MAEKNGNKSPGSEFGPVFSRLYSFFSSRSGRSAKRYGQISDDIATRKPPSVLDVGCGPGLLIKMLSDRLPETVIHGVDPSASMVKLASRRLHGKASRGQARIEVGDSKNVPYGRKYDIIVTTMSFHHWDDHEGSLIYLISLLHDGGSLIIYETLSGKKKPENGKMHHSLSEAEAKEIVVDGCDTLVNTRGDLISVEIMKKA